jgi:hypothetical protein
LSPPPRNATGLVIPHDHSGIAETDKVIRRISKQHIVPDPKAPTGRRIASLAYQESTTGCRGMSVDLECSIVDAGLNPANFVTSPEFLGSVWFSVGYLRTEERLQVGYDPIPDNAHHGEVWGITEAHRRRLHRKAQWFVQIPGVGLCGR